MRGESGVFFRGEGGLDREAPEAARDGDAEQVCACKGPWWLRSALWRAAVEEGSPDGFKHAWLDLDVNNNLQRRGGHRARVEGSGREKVGVCVQRLILSVFRLHAMFSIQVFYSCFEKSTFQMNGSMNWRQERRSP